MRIAFRRVRSVPIIPIWASYSKTISIERNGSARTTVQRGSPGLESNYRFSVFFSGGGATSSALALSARGESGKSARKVSYSWTAFKVWD